MNWSSLPTNPQTDAAMRRAAARLCNYTYVETKFGAGVWQAGAVFLDCSRWLLNWNRDDLARVFGATAVTEMVHRDPMFHGAELAWSIARTNPRAALASLLDLLEVAVPDGLDTAK